jgi:hypothetical protein
MVLGVGLATFGTGCGNACDELADEAEACCEEEEDEFSREFCLSFVDVIREQGDSGECQKALDEGFECEATGGQP